MINTLKYILTDIERLQGTIYGLVIEESKTTEQDEYLEQIYRSMDNTRADVKHLLDHLYGITN